MLNTKNSRIKLAPFVGIRSGSNIRDEGHTGPVGLSGLQSLRVDKVEPSSRTGGQPSLIRAGDLPGASITPPAVVPISPSPFPGGGAVSGGMPSVLPSYAQKSYFPWVLLAAAVTFAWVGVKK